jgi:nitroreductase
MDLLETIRSTGAVRDFLPDQIDDEVVYRMLDSARFAPNGGNRQAWKVVVVKDSRIRVALRDLYLEGYYEYAPQAEAGLTPFAAITDRDAEARARARAPEIRARSAAEPPGFAQQFDQCPVLLVVLADLRRLATLDRDLGRYTLVGGASIYPFVWNTLLAARAEGLGGVMTTLPILREPQVKALLNIPDHLCIATVVALGRPVHQPTRLRRDAVEAFTTIDTFDGEPLETR